MIGEENDSVDTFERIRAALQDGGNDTPLSQAVARLKQPFLVKDGETWLYEGFVSLFHTLYSVVREVDASLPPGLSPHCLDPAVIARFFRIPVEQLDRSKVAHRRQQAASITAEAGLALEDRLYTVKEAADHYFQGKVSQREVNKLFHSRMLNGFRVGRLILIYKSSLDEYRLAHENRRPPAADQEAITFADPSIPSPRPERLGRQQVPPVRLKRLPEPE